MNKPASMLGIVLMVFSGMSGLGVYLYNSQTTSVESNVLTQNTDQGSNLNHSSVNNVTYNINHNHYYSTEYKDK